ncbi:MAG: dienelactone hydrolase family protein [Alphaproteobacteria bacterium]
MASNARWETLTVDGVEMQVFIDKPAGAGPHPAVVVAHHRAGIDPPTTKFVQDLAAHGYVAAAPHLHHRRPEGEDTRESIKNLDDVQIVADLQATVDLLKGMGAVDNARMAIAGHCMGGRVSFLGAASIADFKCNVAFYSGNMFKALGAGDVPPLDKLGSLRGPVKGFFGNDDGNPSPEDVAKISAKLDEHGIGHEFHGYDGAGHAFQNFMNPEGYRAAATEDSLVKMFAWLDAML